MPELPEVETVARDLRPRLVGATIVGARVSWARTLRTHDPIAFADGGRRPDGRVGRAARQAARRSSLSGDAALTIHLKMTGQLFVVPGDAPEDPYVRLVLELADGRELRFRDIRKFGRVGLYGRDPVTGELVTEVGGAAVFAAIGPEPLADDVHGARRSGGGCAGARAGSSRCCSTSRSWPASATSTPTSRCGVRASTRSGPPASLRPPDERRLYEAIRAVLAEAVERRGSSIDDYTAPDGDGSMQERLDVYQRTGEPCRRCGRPIKRDRRRRARRRTSARGASGCRPADRKGARAILRTITGGRGAARAGAGPSSRGRGALGLTAGRGRPCRALARTERTKRAAATRRAAARASVARRRRLMSILRLRGRHPRGRHVRDPRRDRRRRSRSATGSAWSARTAPARRRCCGWPPAGTSRTAARSTRKRGLSIGLLAQEAHFDAAFMAAPDLRTAVRTGAAHLDAMADELARARARTGGSASRATPTCSTSSRSSAATRSTSGSMPRCAGSASRGTSGPGRRPRCRAASRRGRRWPGWSSPTRTCCSSTSRRTTSTSTRSSGSRSTSAGGPGSLLVASHDRAFLDATVRGSGSCATGG